MEQLVELTQRGSRLYCSLWWPVSLSIDKEAAAAFGQRKSPVHDKTSKCARGDLNYGEQRNLVECGVQEQTITVSFPGHNSNKTSFQVVILPYPR